MAYVLDSNGLSLTGHLAAPSRVGISGTAGLVICHGFPSGASQGVDDDRSYYDFADLVAKALGWIVDRFIDALLLVVQGLAIVIDFGYKLVDALGGWV